MLKSSFFGLLSSSALHDLSGSAQETQLRSSGEEELDPEQQQEMLEETKESHLSSATPCNLPSVSTLETSGEEQQTCIPVVGDHVGESGLNMHCDIEMNDVPVTDVKNITVCNSQFQEIVTSPEQKVTGTERDECEDIGETSEEAIGTQKVSIADSESIVIKSSDDIRETSCKDLSEEDSTPAISNTEPQHEPENAEDAENEELEEFSKESQPQGATASGKKKKKRKRGKKRKGGTGEDESQKKAKTKTEKENGKTERDLELATRNDGPATEAEIGSAPVETPKELQMDQVKDDQDEQHISETEKAEAVESVSPIIESNLSTTNLIDNSKTTKSTEDYDIECTSTVDDCTDGIEISTNTGALQIESEVIDSTMDEAGSINDVKLESTTHNSENGLETTNSTADVQDESQDPSNVDVATDKSESQDDKLLSPSNTDRFFDCLESLPGSEVPLESNQSTTTNSGNDAAILLSDGAPLEVTETVKDEEEPGVEMEQNSFPCNVTAANHENDHSELRLEETGKEELNGGLKEPEDSLHPDNSSVPFPADAEHCDSCDNASSMKQDDASVNEKKIKETVIQAEHFDDVSGCPVESQGLNTPQCVNQNDESNAEVSLQTKDSDTMEIFQTPDSAKEVPEIGFFIEQDHSDGGLAIAKDPEHQNSQDDQESETFPCPMEKQQQESNKDKPEDNDSSQPTQEDSDEEEEGDEEGQSFDFDDTDLEAAVNVTLETPQEEVAKGVEIVSEEVNRGNSVLCQGDIESNDPMGPQPLSPNHILTMKSSIILPPPGKFEREDLYLRKRWRKVQYLANEFWSRWCKEYLLNLQPRQKWQRKRRNAKVNDIVIVKDDNAPRTEWKLAKVTKVYPAEDGCVRKLQLLISDSTLDKEGKRIGKPVYLERPIHKTVTLIEAE